MEGKSLQAEAGGEIGQLAAVEVAGAVGVLAARHGWHARVARGKPHEAAVADAGKFPVQEGDVPAVSVRAAIDPVAAGSGTTCWEMCFVLGFFSGSLAGLYLLYIVLLHMR